MSEVFVITMGVLDETEQMEIWISQEKAEARIEKLKESWTVGAERLRVEDWQDDTIKSGQKPQIRSWWSPKSEAYITLEKMEVHDASNTVIGSSAGTGCGAEPRAEIIPAEEAKTPPPRRYKIVTVDDKTLADGYVRLRFITLEGRPYPVSGPIIDLPVMTAQFAREFVNDLVMTSPAFTLYGQI